MAPKLALKKLTASDLTLFAWHYQQNKAGKQKAINLNADIFIKLLYPSLPSVAYKNDGRFNVDLYLYGPGLLGEVNLARKIIKHGTYKNWRLDGEIVHNPHLEPERFDSLTSGDVAVLEFRGDPVPSTLSIALISKSIVNDLPLLKLLTELLGNKSMVSITPQQLSEALEASKVPIEHPISAFILEEAMEDASFGGVRGLDFLSARSSGRRLTRAALLDARSRAEAVGYEGEELINMYLERLLENEKIKEYFWEANRNAVAPYDFSITNKLSEQIYVDVKSTRGKFERMIHVSASEANFMSAAVADYRIYRVYNLTETGACLRISGNVVDFSKKIVDALKYLPNGVKSDGVSICPENLDFENEIDIDITDFTS